jgi:hypothetical protein
MGIGDSAGIKAIYKLTTEAIPAARQSAIEVIDRLQKMLDTLLDGAEVTIRITIERKK